MKKEILLNFDAESFEEVKSKMNELYEIADKTGKRIETITNFKIKIDYWFAFLSFLAGIVTGVICLWIVLGQL